jgi:hypothetical protein
MNTIGERVRKLGGTNPQSIGQIGWSRMAGNNVDCATPDRPVGVFEWPLRFL